MLIFHGIQKLADENISQNQPFTAPSMIPISKYFERNGYTIRIGIAVTMEIVYLMTFPLERACLVASEIADVPADISAARFVVWFK